MTIIEADGNEVIPVEVDWVLILAGQRYSVVITANQPVGNYWIRSLRVQLGVPETFEGGQNMAILRYQGAPDQDPTSVPGPYELSFDEGNLHPLIHQGVPGIPEIGGADVNIQLMPGTTSEGYFTLNGVTYVHPTVPVLLQMLSGAVHPSQLLPNGSVYELPPNAVVELSFPNPLAAPGIPVRALYVNRYFMLISSRRFSTLCICMAYVIHFSKLSLCVSNRTRFQHQFDVVRIAGSNTTNFVNPVRRDVVSIGTSPTDNVTIRFVTNNPGPWFLHW